jgi:hypothetical protein
MLAGVDIVLLINLGNHLKSDLDKAQIPYQQTSFSTIEEALAKF